MKFNAKLFNQNAVYEAIKLWYNDHAYGPSYRDLVKITGVSLGTVYNVCHELRDTGMIEFEDNVARTIKVKEKK